MGHPGAMNLHLLVGHIRQNLIAKTQQQGRKDWEGRDLQQGGWPISHTNHCSGENNSSDEELEAAAAMVILHTPLPRER